MSECATFFDPDSPFAKLQTEHATAVEAVLAMKPKLQELKESKAASADSDARAKQARTLSLLPGGDGGGMSAAQTTVLKSGNGLVRARTSTLSLYRLLPASNRADSADKFVSGVVRSLGLSLRESSPIAALRRLAEAVADISELERWLACAGQLDITKLKKETKQISGKPLPIFIKLARMVSQHLPYNSGVCAQLREFEERRERDLLSVLRAKADRAESRARKAGSAFDAIMRIWCGIVSYSITFVLMPSKSCRQNEPAQEAIDDDADFNSGRKEAVELPLLSQSKAAFRVALAECAAAAAGKKYMN